MTSKPDVKVLGVGLGRTGTLSLSVALTTLGFGPCYHMTTTFVNKGKDIPAWLNVHRGIETTENLYKIFEGYKSGCDYPQAVYPEALVKAFPDAKYILSIRPVDKWKISVANTINHACHNAYLPSFFNAFAKQFYEWTQEMIWVGQFDGDFEGTAEKKWDEHIAKVKRVIPEEQLLIYEVGEGWDRLCGFLGVPIPDEPYPRVNDTAAFTPQNIGAKMLPSWLVPLFVLNHHLRLWFGK